MQHTAEWWRAYRQQKRESGTPLKGGKDTRVNRKRPDRDGIARSGNNLSKWKRAQFVTWDGEGYTDASGVHRYFILASSSGTHLASIEGLSTIDCLTFLYEGYKANCLAVHCFFAGDYDINMILSECSKDELTELLRGEFLDIGPYRVTYMPRHRFTIEKRGEQFGGHDVMRQAVFYDCWGFFQGTFVKAIEDFLGEIPELARIKTDKARRSQFKIEEMEEILDYCKDECRLLVQILGILHKAIDTAQLGPLERYDGAGAIAAQILKQRNVKQYMNDNVPIKVQDAARHGYFGGRNEITCIGNYEKPCYGYDVNSAYPAANRELPCLQHGYWRHFARDARGVFNVFSLVHVRWSYRSRQLPLYPLPFRLENGNILFPPSGEGWYWGVEVLAAFDHANTFYDPYAIEILESWQFIRQCTHMPFAFMNDIYVQRCGFKRDGNMAHVPIKLGMNSVYGKLAQQIGKRRPPYHQLEWAGYTTSVTRAQLLSAALQSPNDVLMFATDAVYSKTELHVPCSDELGEWERKNYGGITICQSGVYWTYAPNKKTMEFEWSTYSRGFGKDDAKTLRQQVLDAWRCGKQSITVTAQRFVSMRSVVAGLEPFERWRTWPHFERELQVGVTGKRELTKKLQGAHKQLIPTFARPVEPWESQVSAPHKLRGAGWVKAEDIIYEELEPERLSLWHE